jgi:hypothetical protein
MKEVIAVAQRALKLTLQPWEVRIADDFDRVFAAIGKHSPDGLYVSSAGSVLRGNRKRIVGFALNSRLRPCIRTETFRCRQADVLRG